MKNACHPTPPASQLRRILFALPLIGCAVALTVPAVARDGSPPSAAALRTAQVEVEPAQPPPPPEEPAPAPEEVSPLPEEAVPETELAPVEPDVAPSPPPTAQPPMPPRPPRPMRPSTPGPRPRPAPLVPRAADVSTAPGDFEPITDLDPDEPINFNFENSDLVEVVKSIGRYTGKNFDIDPQVSGQMVTIIMHQPVPAKMAYEVLESVLASRGLAMVPTVDGNLIKVVPQGTLQEKWEGPEGAVAPMEGFDRISTHVVGVEYANVSEIAELVRTLGSATAAVDVYAPTNSLIITDNADGIRRMLEFLEMIDIPGADTETQIFMLEYTSAEVLATQIQEVLMGTAGPGMPGAPGVPGAPVPPRPQAPQRPLRPNVPGAPRQAQVVGATEPVLRMVPDDRLNALIVVASRDLMEQVRDLIDKLDTTAPIEFGNTHIYNLQNANAEELVDALNSFTGAAPPAQTGGGPGGAPGGGGGGGGGGGAPSAMVAAFEREVSITQYEKTNSLLIVASPQDYKRLVEIIARLDVPPRQVSVDAVIMEVGINDNFSLAVESVALTANDYFALNNVVQLSNLLTQGPLASPPAGTTLGILDGTTQVTAVIGGVPTVQEIPNVPLLLTALEAITDLNVLSQPSLTTVDNEEASIVDGLNIPFIRGSSTSLDQSAIGRSVFNSIDRQDTGMKLTVTPQISEGDYVYLELAVELSQPVQSNVGADPNVVGPTIQKTEVKNHVVIKDGSIGVIGGFLRESTDRSVRQPPILGDVPLVGWLFRRKDNTRAKRNLVMLVTPHVIKERKDLDRVTDYKVGQFQDANADVIFEQGFIRKIERKQFERNKRHPSFDKAEEIRSEQPFGRGSIER